MSSVTDVVSEPASTWNESKRKSDFRLQSRSSFERHLKRFLDIAIGTVGLLVALPVIVLAAIAVFIDDGWPVFFRSRRVGLHGMEFFAFKMRTMRRGEDLWLRDSPEYQANVKLMSDPRVTVVGRWLRRLSIDELPQIVNVLKGEMSLVGPRIMLPEERERWGDLVALRLSVPPGLTGLWQVSGRALLPYDERIRLDCKYIQEWSLWSDFLILLRTVPAALSGRGAV